MSSTPFSLFERFATCSVIEEKLKKMGSLRGNAMGGSDDFN
jgi:hypothetical protein